MRETRRSGGRRGGAIVAVLVAAFAVAYVLAHRGETTSARGDGGEPSEREPPLEAPPARLEVRVVRAYPHDRDSFTQGLLWHDGQLFESAGLYGRSSLRRVDLETGLVQERRDLEPAFFAEGLARVAGRLYQLTWREGRAFVWEIAGLRQVRTIAYEGEGWGLCHDGTHLVMSDGSSRLTFREPETLRVVRSVRVHDRGEPIDQLNELECVDGAVWANVWQTDRILRIDPRTGRVTAVVDASGLLTEQEAQEADVLNGIAWIPERGHFVITGKLWPRLFEVEFVPRGRARARATRR